MPFKQTWYIQDHVVKVEFWGILTIEDVVKSFNVSGKFLIESQAHSVHFIHDWTKLEHIPTNFREIRNRVDFNQNPAFGKLGSVLIYGAGQASLKTVGDLIFQMFQIRTHMTDKLESALAYLQQQEPHLQSLLHQKVLTHVKWQLQGHILYSHHPHSAEDITLRNQNALKLILAEGKPPAVHMLIDFSLIEGSEYPKDVRELLRISTSSPEFQEARDNLIHHPLFGWVVVFGVQNPNVNVSGKIIAQKYSYKRKEVDTLKEAISFLKHIDPNISNVVSKQVDST